MRWVWVSITIALGLVSIWFNNGRLLARAEEGIPFYDLSRTVNVHRYVWQDIQLGNLNPFFTSRLPLYKSSEILQKIGIPGFRIQQLVFMLLILTPLIAVALLMRTLFPSRAEVVYFSASIFYVFNLFTLSQVLQRFIYPLMFTWSYLPLFLYLWLMWLDTRKVKFLILFLVSSFVFSDAFGLISSVLALWIPGLILWFKSRRGVPAITAIILWVLTNIWWWYPLVFTKDTVYAQNLNVDQNVTSLIDVSKYYPNEETILLKQEYYFGPGSVWFEVFSRKYNVILSWGLVILFLAGMLWSIKLRKGLILLPLIIIGWFLIKGSNPPLGLEFYKWLFTTFPFTVLLRNPYEKLGVIFLLPYCIFLALGLSIIKAHLVRVLVIFVVVFIMLRPYWTNQVFADYVIDVPNAYRLANVYLNTQGNTRLMQLPFLLGAGAKYTWGYEGEEPSTYLFDRPSLSATYYDVSDPYPLMYQHLRSPNMYKLLQLFSVNALVLHHDAVITQNYQENVPGTIAILNKWKHIALTKQFGDIDIYELDRKAASNWGYLSDNIINVSSLKEGLAMVINNEDFSSKRDAFVTSDVKLTIPKDKLPDYEVNKRSGVKYQFNVRNSQSPYLLILSNRFSPQWIAKIEDQELDTHIEANGFANGWLIDKKGDYTIDILFKTWPWE